MIVSTATNRVTHSRVAHSQTRQNTPRDLSWRQTCWHRLVAQSTLGGLGLLALSTVAAFGQGDSQPDVIGYPHPYQMGMQEAVTPVMQELRYLHDNILMPIIVIVTIIVTGLLAYVCWRFREEQKSHPLAHDASYHAGGGLDSRSGPHPGRDRYTLVSSTV